MGIDKCPTKYLLTEMKLTVPALEIDPKEGFSSDKDIFKREQFGRNILNVIENINDELVLAIDAPWGEGKTTFIKMWRGMLAKEEYTSIYFDAFENDYQDDPFLAIAAEIYSIIDDDKESTKSHFKEKTISALKIFGRVGLRLGIKAMTAGVLDDTIFEETNTIKDVSKEASDLVDSYVNQRLENAKQDKQNLLEFKRTLNNLASDIGDDKPLIFIIDELDRCKPPFALAILENIKHLYSVENIVFVLVMNRTQIEESVRCEYGSGVEASKYLQKFVHLWASLPKRNDDYKHDAEEYLLNCLDRMDFVAVNQTRKTAREIYKELVVHYNLSLREIERSLTNYSLLYNMSNDNLPFYHQQMQVYLSIIKVINPEIYRELSNNSISYQKVVEETLLETLEINFLGIDNLLTFSLKCCLLSKEEMHEFIDKATEYPQDKSNMIQKYDMAKSCLEHTLKWMNTFSTAY
ncbi:MAG: P-loop NTPase fold protein [Cyanobacteria bacterium J06648_1]